MLAEITEEKTETREAARLSIDFPRRGEAINSPAYTLRLSVPSGVKTVEVCLDENDWQACRQAVGYWWLDWSRYLDGEHSAVVRVELRDGHKIISAPHHFFVDTRPKPAMR